MSCVICGGPSRLENPPRCKKHRKYTYRIECAVCGKTIWSKHRTTTRHRACRPNGKNVNARAERISPEKVTLESVDGGTSLIAEYRGSAKRIKTLEQLLEATEADLSIYEVDHYVANKWEVGAKDSRGEIVVEPLFQIKAWLKRKVQEIRLDALKAELVEMLEQRGRADPARLPAAKKSRDGLMLELGLYDLHLGKRAWAEEAGEDYDLKIASDLFRWAIEKTIRHCKNHGFDISEVIFPLGNDFFHYDTLSQTTTKGTPVASDSRWLKVLRTGTELVTWAIDVLRSELGAEVKLLSIPGNHEEQTLVSLVEILSAIFGKAPDVSIENSPRRRKYVRWGTSLIGFAHGNDEKMKDLPSIMASEADDLWSGSKIREMHIGHLHQRRVLDHLREYNGVVVRILPSLSATDAWHHAQGYVGNLRSAESYLWSREQGMVGSIHANLLSFGN